ncbi:MAG: hypothetical protein NVS9B15_20740 [Acidobacteriaceae bacterium]
MEQLIATDKREEALLTFLRGMVIISQPEMDAMKARPSWPSLVASVESSIRQDRAPSAYHFCAARMRRLQTPTLLLSGSNTESTELKLALRSLADFLPKAKAVVFQGQEHNASIVRERVRNSTYRKHS